MSNEIKNIEFALRKISTEQFAMFEENLISKNDSIKLETNIQYGLNQEQQSIRVIPKFRFEQKNKPFLSIEVACHFVLSDDSWEYVVKQKDHDSVKFPKNFIKHLSVLAIGTARGVLHAKTENTLFNEFILPTVNLNELIPDDILLNF